MPQGVVRDDGCLREEKQHDANQAQDADCCQRGISVLTNHLSSGERLVAVIPGEELISKNLGTPSDGSKKSARAIPRISRALYANRACSCAESVALSEMGAGTK